MAFNQLFLKGFHEKDDKVTKNYLEKGWANILFILDIEQNEELKEESNYNNYKCMKYYVII